MMYVCKVTTREICIFIIYTFGEGRGEDDIEDVITLETSIELLLKLQICRN